MFEYSLPTCRQVLLVLICGFGLLYLPSETSAQIDYSAIDAKVLLETTNGSYHGSDSRDSIDSLGMFIMLDYLEQGGITFATHSTQVNGGLEVKENQTYASGRYHLYSDLLSGKLSTRLDMYRISDVYTSSDDINIYSIILSYLDNPREHYVELAYSQSEYVSDSSFIDNAEVVQFSAAAGKSISRYNWIFLRYSMLGYNINNRLDNITNGKDFMVKFTHWLQPHKYLPYQVSLGLSSGNSTYLINHDAASVYTAPDRKISSYDLGAQWKITEKFSLSPHLGSDQFKAGFTNRKYRNQYTYVNISYSW